MDEERKSYALGRKQILKIRLIEPKPSGVNVYDLVKMPRLGLPIIGTILRDAGHDVRTYCEILAPVDWDDLLGSDLVGISTTTSTAPRGYRMAKRLAEAGIPVIMGGSHVTFLPDEALEYVPYVARGEGHRTMQELVAHLEGGEPALDGILGLSYREGDRMIHNPARPPCGSEEFGELPIPDFGLVAGGDKMPVRSVMTQWGCPYSCDFCSVIQMFGRKVKSKAVDRVIEELETTQPKFVFFCDDNFITDKKRAMDLLRRIQARGLRFSWSAQMRAETVFRNRKTKELDEELLGLMRDTGCAMAYVGFESVNPETLKAYHKEQDVADIEASIRAFHRYGIKVHGMFVLGADQDTVQTVRETANFALDNQIDTVQFMLLQPLPGTPLYERVKAEGRILHDDWSLYDGHHAMVRVPNISPYQLQIEAYRAMKKFYSNWQFFKLLVGGVTLAARDLWRPFWREPSTRAALLGALGAMLLPLRRRREGILLALRERLGRKNWRVLEDNLWLPYLRSYGHKQVVKWQEELEACRYLEFLRGLEALPTINCPIKP